MKTDYSTNENQNKTEAKTTSTKSTKTPSSTKPTTVIEKTNKVISQATKKPYYDPYDAYFFDFYTSQSQTGTSTMTTTTYTPPKTTKTGKCIVEFNTNYPGGDISGQNEVNNATECCNLCAFTPKCVGWSYYVEFSYCFFKSSIPSKENKQYYDGIWSGQIAK